MGRHIKNRELRSGGYAIRMPHSPSAAGPSSPVDGLVRFNETNNKLEYYSLGAWRTFAIEGTTLITKDTFTGDGVLRDFGPLSFSYGVGEETSVLVFIGNVFQNPGVAYTIDVDIIKFTSTPGDQQPIVILHGYASTAAIM